ncbi:hypothetical protein MACK_003917 [Theileria orientalis]|uniref:Uncharacterized protein n=1 Tax=Theileria orientalis TaxID=68886 RepID=A0A976SJ50_THEOR|nr:hypothetical protein MACK_003917 [Theileria orientalis]
MDRITIDLDNKGVPYVSGIFTIEFLQLPFEDCDTIDRMVHYPVGNCKLECLKSKILDVNINNNEIHSDVAYVYVFFSKIKETIPIVFGVSTGNDDDVSYYTGFGEIKKTYQLSSLEKVCKENLLDVLVRESDRVNNTVTYLLDKQRNYNNITVTARKIHGPDRPEIFTHRPNTATKTGHSLVMLNYKKSVTKPDVSSFLIPGLSVYWYETPEVKPKTIPLAFDFSIYGFYYYYTRDKNDGNEWTNFLNNSHNILRIKRGEYTEINDIEKRLPEKVEDQVPYGFNALFLGLIFYILFTIGFCLPPLYKIYRHIIKRYIGKHSTN